MSALSLPGTRITQLEPADAAVWRDIRLEALLKDPEQFSALHADWVARPLIDFADMIDATPVWAVLAGDRAVAAAAHHADEDHPDIGWLMALYVRPEARGMGHAQRLIATVEAAAGTRGVKEMRLNVRAINPAARGLYGRMGYREIQPEGASPCGKCEITMAKLI